MDALCSKCGKQIAPQWSFCAQCGAAVNHESHAQAEHEAAPARGAYGGLLYGVIAAPILILAGIMLSLTGWGIFLGLPMILAGILAPLAGPLFGMGERKGRCPSCGTLVISSGDGLLHDCPACNERFAIGHKEARAV